MSEYSSDQYDNDHQQSDFLTRQVVSLDDIDHRTKKSSRNGNKLDNQGEAIFLETERNEIPFTNSNQQQILSPEKNKSASIVDLFSPDELETNTENIHPNPKPNTPAQTRRPISKIPIRLNSSFRNHRQKSSNKGAFHFFTSNDEQTETSSFKDQRKRLASSDDEDIHLKEDDLKRKLKEEKQQGKKTGELLTKLHENYEELLEKYAHAENTIDQLRFQPKISGDNTPKTNTTEHFIHLIQQSKVNITALRSSGVYGSPLSSIRPVPSTTTATPVRKSVSPTNSGTIESIFFDEVSPEILKVDLLFETKTLGEKMKSFLMLMDESQLNLAEQKEVYEKIKQDYEKLIKDFDQNKLGVDLDADLHKELEMMKELLKDIVKRITQNLLGKSMIESSPERLASDNSHSSQLSVRSSLCNHNDLMDQYHKLLNAVNTTKSSPIKLENNEKSDLPERRQSIKSKQKAYVYVSGDSDDEQQENDGITPIPYTPYTKGVESTSFGLDYIPSTSVKHHQHPIEEQRYENFPSKRKQLPRENRYSTTSRTNDYDSGIGTNNLTKLSYDSKLYTSTMDESHFQSLDDEQESISSSSSSRSSGSGSASPGSPYSKKIDKQSIYRRKPSGHSNPYQFDTETHITGSFNLPTESYKKKNMQQSYHTWRPQKPSITHRSRLTPVHRSASIAAPSIEDYKMRSRRPLTNLEISSKIKNNQDLYYPSKTPSSYKSSIYINHTDNKSKEKSDPNLYLDPQTGIVYRYESEKNSNPPRIYYEPLSPSKLYRCMECGSLTNYHHRHHLGSSLKRVTTNADDLGYESGHQRRHHRYRYIDYLSTSSSSSDDSDSDVSPTYLEMIALNQAYKRAENIRYQSRCLSKYIVRQLKLALATL